MRERPQSVQVRYWGKASGCRRGIGGRRGPNGRGSVVWDVPSDPGRSVVEWGRGWGSKTTEAGRFGTWQNPRGRSCSQVHTSAESGPRPQGPQVARRFRVGWAGPKMWIGAPGAAWRLDAARRSRSYRGIVVAPCAGPLQANGPRGSLTSPIRGLRPRGSGCQPPAVCVVLFGRTST
jgi:hypothetical protein